MNPGALVDYLSFTVKKAFLFSPDCPVVHRIGPDLLDSQSAQRLVSLLLPYSSIEAEAFTTRGFLGYTHSAKLSVPGVAGQVGVVAHGGNGDTVYVSISGAGCPFVGDFRRVALSLEAVGAVLTRVDVAFDDLEGEFLDVHFLRRLARSGFFDTENGQRVKRKSVDDLDSLGGNSLYLGKKGAKELCIYEKGKQLQAPESRWVRAECRLWSRDRVIPYDILTRPGAYLRGEWPQLRSFLPYAAPSRAKVMKAQSEATGEAARRWLELAAGKTLNLLRRAADSAGVHPFEALHIVCRDGMPQRFAGLPEEVAIRRIEGIFKGAPA